MIRSMIRRLVNWAHPGEFADTPIRPAKLASSDSIDHSIDVTGLSFKVMPAIGGIVVKTRHYDERKDRNNYTTYLVTADEDISVRVGQIVSLELMKV